MLSLELSRDIRLDEYRRRTPFVFRDISLTANATIDSGTVGHIFGVNIMEPAPSTLIINDTNTESFFEARVGNSNESELIMRSSSGARYRVWIDDVSGLPEVRAERDNR